MTLFLNDPPRQFVRVVVRDIIGRFLVLQHRDSAWNFPGGKVERSESADAAARRELREEVGLCALGLELLAVRDISFGGEVWRGSFFYAASFAGKPRTVEPDKHRTVALLSYAEIVEHAGPRTYMVDIVNDIPLHAFVASVCY